jgi:segregation and condensation protein B
MSDNPENTAPDMATESEAPNPADAEGATDPHHLRLLEAVLFSTDDPLTEDAIAERLPDGAEVPALLAELAGHYENHGINLVRAGGRWLFRTAEDLSQELRVHKTVPRRLSRAAMETLAIIAYHQPVTRAEIEEIRGVGLSRGTLDLLLESNWIAPKGRRRTAGRPATWGTTPSFLVDFGIDSIKDLPGLDDLKAAGLLDKRPAMQISEFTNLGEDDESDDDEELADESVEADAEDEELGVSLPTDDDDSATGEGQNEDSARQPDGPPTAPPDKSA